MYTTLYDIIKQNPPDWFMSDLVVGLGLQPVEDNQWQRLYLQPDQVVSFDTIISLCGVKGGFWALCTQNKSLVDRVCLDVCESMIRYYQEVYPDTLLSGVVPAMRRWDGLDCRSAREFNQMAERLSDVIDKIKGDVEKARGVAERAFEYWASSTDLNIVSALLAQCVSSKMSGAGGGIAAFSSFTNWTCANTVKSARDEHDRLVRAGRAINTVGLTCSVLFGFGDLVALCDESLACEGQEKVNREILRKHLHLSEEVDRVK